MKPEEWLRLTAVVKIRNKLSSWTREDIVAYSNQEFNSTNLTKQQVSELCEKLKQKRLEKPGKQFYLSDSIASTVVPTEFRLVKNLGQLGWPQSYWYFSNSRACLRFSTLKELASWAFNLMEQNPRQLWTDIIKNWRDKTKLVNFSKETALGYPIDETLQKILNKRQVYTSYSRTPLPDNADIKKQYWGLDIGDKLINGDQQIEVLEVRANLDTPPTITFRGIT